MQEFQEMVDVMHRLRKECPWDQKQSLSSLRKYLIEEAYETLAAMEESIETDKYESLIEELGDLLLQILFQSEIMTEKLGRPVIKDVVTGLRDKMIRRHPHVFGEKRAMSSEEVHAQWDRIKAKEKSQSPSLMDDIPLSFPALMKAQKIGKKSEKIQFDWNNKEEVWEQAESEIQELKEASNIDEIQEELGDVLFSLVQFARHNGLEAEVCLAAANEKFLWRFKRMEQLAESDGKKFEDFSLNEKEKLWKQAKADEKKARL